MSPASAKLIVRFGPHPNQEYPLPSHTVTIGREPINDIVMNDSEVSRRHTRISFRDGEYQAEDLGSTNGTFINGRRLSGPTPLHHGDIIDLGDSISFTFHDPGSAGYGATVIDSGIARPDQMGRTEYIPYSGGHAQSASRPAAQPATAYEQPYDPTERVTGPMPPAPAGRPRTSNGRIIAGCGCLFLMATVLCIATILLLDTYNNGVLLYCGPLRPLWDAILGAGSVAQQCGTL
jgi:hypothetical protein